VGRGDEIYPLADAPRLGLVIVQPDFNIATADAYRWFDEASADRPAAERQPLDLGWRSGPLQVRNSLQAPVADRHPAMAHIVRALLAAGAVTAAMTGSGSAVFGVFPARAAGVARTLARKSSGWSVWATQTLSRRDAGRRIGL
jgi:4-diphosphocytidyl-2-C-methyl-D-erythritol kinase